MGPHIGSHVQEDDVVVDSVRLRLPELMDWGVVVEVLVVVVVFVVVVADAVAAGGLNCSHGDEKQPEEDKLEV